MFPKKLLPHLPLHPAVVKPVKPEMLFGKEFPLRCPGRRHPWTPSAGLDNRTQSSIRSSTRKCGRPKGQGSCCKCSPIAPLSFSTATAMARRPSSTRMKSDPSRRSEMNHSSSRELETLADLQVFCGDKFAHLVPGLAKLAGLNMPPEPIVRSRKGESIRCQRQAVNAAFFEKSSKSAKPVRKLEFTAARGAAKAPPPHSWPS